MRNNYCYDCSDCKHAECSYSEYDTGYEEFTCDLLEKAYKNNKKWELVGCPKENKIIEIKE